MRIDRAALIRGMAAAINRERERRQAAERAKAEAAWQGILDKIAEMASRLAVGRFAAADRELAEQLVRTRDWEHIDQLRVATDRSRAECVALVWNIDPEAAERLLLAYYAP
jgi:glucan biosynthesis protein